MTYRVIATGHRRAIRTGIHGSRTDCRARLRDLAARFPDSALSASGDRLVIPHPDRSDEPSGFALELHPEGGEP